MSLRFLSLLACALLLSSCKAAKGPSAGVGMLLAEHGHSLVVVETFPGKPARAAGVEVGDNLLSVNGRSVAGMPVEEAAALIAGDAGTEVRVQLLRKDKPVELVLVRAKL